MDNRRWLWIGACLLVAGAIFWGVGQAVNPSSGDTEFKKTLESMKQVRSFRGAYIESASGTQHSERLWEVDCNRVMVHQQSHDSQSNTDSPFEMKEKEDELLVANRGIPAPATDRGRTPGTQVSAVQPSGIATTLRAGLLAICCRICLLWSATP